MKKKSEKHKRPLKQRIIITLLDVFNPNPHGMFWTKVIYDFASSEPYSLSSLNRKNLKKYPHVQKDLGNTL